MKLKIKKKSLSFELNKTAEVLSLIEKGRSLSYSLDFIIKSNELFDSIGAIKSFTYKSLRNWGTAEYQTKFIMDVPSKFSKFKSLIKCSLTLLSDPKKPYKEYTLVNETVNACKLDPQLSKFCGLTNASLRNFLRNRNYINSKVKENEEAFWNYPQWWINKTKMNWPNDWQKILKSGNNIPPLTLRVNKKKISVCDYLSLLNEKSLIAEQIGPWAIKLKNPTNVEKIPGFNDGLVSIQDAAAQLAAPLLDVNKGMYVLDACAAPGGKTCHLLEFADLSLISIDNNKNRLNLVRENLNRLKLEANVVYCDAKLNDWWDGNYFDRILVDVPCTSSGVVRRNPDIRWLRKPEDSKFLSNESTLILNNLWDMLLPGGKLLFVTCSIWPEESIEVAEKFAKNNMAIKLNSPGQILPQNLNNNHDGLFFALFKKPIGKI
tara:strand:+ start:159 stop:1457 length:1299 start_codon:yes stop_codon:yes gene_type:complete